MNDPWTTSISINWNPFEATAKTTPAVGFLSEPSCRHSLISPGKHTHTITHVILYVLFIFSLFYLRYVYDIYVYICNLRRLIYLPLIHICIFASHKVAALSPGALAAAHSVRDLDQLGGRLVDLFPMGLSENMVPLNPLVSRDFPHVH